MIMLRGPTKKQESNEKNIKSSKQTKKIKNLRNSPVGNIHRIKEDGGAVSGVDNNVIDGDVAIFVHGMVIINVTKSNHQSMISLPHEKHLANKVREVGIILKHELKLITSLLP